MGFRAPPADPTLQLLWGMKMLSFRDLKSGHKWRHGTNISTVLITTATAIHSHLPRYTLHIKCNFLFLTLITYFHILRKIVSSDFWSKSSSGFFVLFLWVFYCCCYCLFFFLLSSIIWGTWEDLESEFFNYWDFLNLFNYEIFLSYPDHSFPSIHSSALPDPLLHCFFLRKVQASKRVQSNKTRYAKTRQKLSYQGWKRQYNRRKRMRIASKRVRDTTVPTVGSPQKIPNILNL